MLRHACRIWHVRMCAGLSCNSLLGRFMVFSTDTEVTHRMLSVNDPSSLLMAVHPSARDILGPGNLAFMHGPAHRAIRKSFLALFTRCCPLCTRPSPGTPKTMS